MCISGLKHAQEILIIDISTSNMSFLQYLEVKIPYPTYISWKPPTTNRNPHSWWKYRIPRFHYKSSTDVGLKGDLGLLVMTRQLVVYILLFVGWVSTNSTSRCISQYRPWLHLSPIYALLKSGLVLVCILWLFPDPCALHIPYYCYKILTLTHYTVGLCK